jgi:hypothetical protein
MGVDATIFRSRYRWACANSYFFISLLYKSFRLGVISRPDLIQSSKSRSSNSVIVISCRAAWILNSWRTCSGTLKFRQTSLLVVFADPRRLARKYSMSFTLPDKSSMCVLPLMRCIGSVTSSRDQFLRLNNPRGTLPRSNISVNHFPLVTCLATLARGYSASQKELRQQSPSVETGRRYKIRPRPRGICRPPVLSKKCRRPKITMTDRIVISDKADKIRPVTTADGTVPLRKVNPQSTPKTNM